MPLVCHDLPWSFGWSFSFLCAASSSRVGRKGDQSLCTCRRPQWVPAPTVHSFAMSVHAQVTGRLLCGVPLFLLPSFSYKVKLEEQSLLDVQGWTQRDNLSFGLGWGVKGMVHLITLINMTARHALALWDCLLRTVFLRLPTQNLSRKLCSMTFKLKRWWGGGRTDTKPL